MGKSCWMARLTIQQLFPIQIFLILLIFKLLPNCTYFFLLLSFPVLTKCQVLNLRVGRSHDQVLQRAYSSRIDTRVDADVELNSVEPNTK